MRRRYFWILVLNLWIIGLVVRTQSSSNDKPDINLDFLNQDVEDDSWFIPYRELMHKWEEEVYSADSMQISKYQEQQIYINRALNNSDEVIQDLDQYQSKFYREAKAYSWDVFHHLHNYSVGLEDITLENFRVAERISRWHERVARQNRDFENGILYMGQFFQALILLNYEVFLVPDYSEYSKQVEFTYTKAFDLDKLWDWMYDINIASLQVDLKFVDMYGWIPNSFCKRSIRYYQRNIFQAWKHLMNLVDALRKSRPGVDYYGTQSLPQNDPDVIKHLGLLKKECSGNKCEEGIRTLLEYINYYTDEVPTNCRIVPLLLEGDRDRMFTKPPFPLEWPPCWRDSLMLQGGSMIQFILQGLIVTQVYRHNFQQIGFQKDESLVNDFWPKYLKVTGNLTYLGDKCKYEQWGEGIVKERFPLWLEKIFEYDKETLELIVPMPEYTPWPVWFTKALEWYLTTYHSDYRWIVKMYKRHRRDNPYGTVDFRGSIMHIFNHAKSEWNFIVYGSPRHEYFYGQFNLEYYHEFCFGDTTLNMEALMKLLIDAPPLDIMSL